MKSRLEEALETADALMALTKMKNMTLEERGNVNSELMRRHDRVRSDLTYLVENLHPSDPRQAAAQALLRIVEKVGY